MSILAQPFESPFEVAATDAAGRLAQLGITPARIESALDDGDVAARQLDKYAPRTGAGLSRWIHTVAGLRRGLAADRWGVDDERNIPIVSHPTNGTVIRVASGTSATGIAGGDGPQRKHPRSGRRGASIPGQLMLDLEDPYFPWAPAQGQRLWWLLYYRSHTDELRAELSWAMRESSSGLLSWGERILLPPRSFGADVALPLDAGLRDDDVDFAIHER